MSGEADSISGTYDLIAETVAEYFTAFTTGENVGSRIDLPDRFDEPESLGEDSIFRNDDERLWNYALTPSNNQPNYTDEDVENFKQEIYNFVKSDIPGSIRTADGPGNQLSKLAESANLGEAGIRRSGAEELRKTRAYPFNVEIDYEVNTDGTGSVGLRSGKKYDNELTLIELD